MPRSGGGVGLASQKAKFSSVKVGYDQNSDDDIDDVGDDLVVNETFAGTTITPTYDPRLAAGFCEARVAQRHPRSARGGVSRRSLRFDGTHRYTYDAWTLRCLGQRWLKILWKMWQTGRRYDAELHQRNQVEHGSWVIALAPVTSAG